MFKFQDIKHILAPQYEELTADKIYQKVKGIFDNLANYLPKYDSHMLFLKII